MHRCFSTVFMTVHIMPTILLQNINYFGVSKINQVLIHYIIPEELAILFTAMKIKYNTVDAMFPPPVDTLCNLPFHVPFLSFKVNL